MSKLTVLIVGGGAREHALYWAIGKSPLVGRVLCTPGNGGIDPENVRNVKDSDLQGIVDLAKSEKIDLVVVGPEAPLVGGLVDMLSAEGIKAFGPTAAAARLEGSKVFMKGLCSQWGIPSASYDLAESYASAEEVIKTTGFRVIKADGLCGGKGVVVASDENEALGAAHQMLVMKIHKEAGERIVIEHRLAGEECSMMFLCDGEHAEFLPVARDYKRALEGDKGPNTGGMGSYSPLPDVDSALEAEVRETIILPTLRAMEIIGAPFRGLLYAGLMLTKDGPKLLEYNVRFGDPETQVVLPRLESDIVEYMLACTERGGLAKLGALEYKPVAAVCVVLTSQGYPGKYDTGLPIVGVNHSNDYTLLFHAGTKLGDSGLMTSGGRVMSVVGLSSSIVAARNYAYNRADEVKFGNKCRREDIADGVLL